jgi:hypothetical protein
MMMDKVSAQVTMLAVLCLTLIAVYSGEASSAISAIAGLVTGGGIGYAIGKEK